MKLKELLEITGEYEELQIKVDNISIFVGNKHDLKQKSFYEKIYNFRVKDTSVFASYFVINLEAVDKEDARLSVQSPLQEEKKEKKESDQLNLSNESKELIEQEYSILNEAENLAKRLFHLEKSTETNAKLIENIVAINSVKMSIEDICYKYKDMELLERINQTTEIKKGGK